MATFTEIPMIPPLVFLFLLFLTSFIQTTISEEPPLNLQMYHGTLQPGFLFSRVLGELTHSKNNVVLCSPTTSSTTSSERSTQGSPTDVLQRRARLIEGEESKSKHTTPKSSTIEPQLKIFQDCESGASSASSSSPAVKFGVTNLNNAKVVNVFRDNCKGKELIPCLGTHAVSSIINAYKQSLRRDLKVACCKLQYCQQRHDMNACQMCFQQDAHKQKVQSILCESFMIF